MKVTWRNRRNTKTPTKAFDVSDVRRLTESSAALPMLPGEPPRPVRAATQH